GGNFSAQRVVPPPPMEPAEYHVVEGVEAREYPAMGGRDAGDMVWSDPGRIDGGQWCARSADDVGCCIADCRISAPSGGVGRSITRNDMTQAECEGSFRDCERTWRSEACAAHPEVRELHMSPGVPALAPEEETRTPTDEE